MQFENVNTNKFIAFILEPICNKNIDRNDENSQV